MFRKGKILDTVEKRKTISLKGKIILNRRKERMFRKEGKVSKTISMKGKNLNRGRKKKVKYPR
jgi:hypothetical protein